MVAVLSTQPIVFCEAPAGPRPHLGVAGLRGRRWSERDVRPKLVLRNQNRVRAHAVVPRPDAGRPVHDYGAAPPEQCTDRRGVTTIGPEPAGGSQVDDDALSR